MPNDLTPAERRHDFLAERRTDYIKTFSNPVAERVLADLASFCRAEQSCFHADPRVHAVLEGRREVYLRIMDHLKLDVDELLRRYDRPSNPAA